MSSRIILPGGISSLLRQTQAYDLLESSVVVFGVDGAVRYRNPPAIQLDKTISADCYFGPDQCGLSLLPAIGSLLHEVCESASERRLQQRFFYGRNTGVTLTLVLRPVINAGSSAVEGAMLTIGEEQLEFDRRHLARAQASMEELRAQVKKLSRARIENERLIRILITEMPIPLILFDDNRRIVQLNRAASTLFGVEPRTAVGTRCDAHLDCYNRCNELCPVIKDMRRIDLDEALSCAGPHGSRQLLHTAVPFAEGDRHMVLEAFIDVTDRNRAEAKLAHYREELEDVVAERTAKLEQTVEELESFSYTVSHDLRSPLRAIDGFSQALLEEYAGVLDEVGAEYLHRSRSAAQRMGKLIDDLLNLSRISRIRLSRKVVNVSMIGRQIAGDLQAAANDRTVTIEVQSGLRAQAEPGLVNALLTNLMTNAWKFTAACSPGTIEVGATLIEGETVFYVRDNGSGFPMQYASKLFQPFHVLDPKAAASGTGIGLATVQRIVHRHGGSIWAKSAPGEGATFYFTLEP